MSQHDKEENLSDVTPAPYESPPIVAEVVVHAQPKPRVWTAICVPLVAIVASLVVAIVVFVAAIFLIVGQPDPSKMDEVLAKILDHPLGIWALVLPGQLTFLAAALVAALLSPIPTGKRLRLGSGRFPIWTWLMFLIATPCVGIATGALIEATGIEPSEHLKMLEEIMTSQTGLAFFVCIFLVAVVPGFVEEILFRGYVQGRLLRRWSPTAAILLSSLLFAVAHMDPLHVCAVFPAGVWLGVIAYRANSIWPAVLCHFGNNFLSLIASHLGTETFGFGNAELLILIPSAIAMLASLYFLFSDRRSTPNDEAVLL